MQVRSLSQEDPLEKEMATQYSCLEDPIDGGALWTTVHESHRRTVQKNLHDPHNHNGVITHLEPNILECEVKWALGSITTNKSSGGGGIPVEVFQILKDNTVKVLTQYASKFGKLSSGHRTGKGQFSFQS